MEIPPAGPTLGITPSSGNDERSDLLDYFNSLKGSSDPATAWVADQICPLIQGCETAADIETVVNNFIQEPQSQYPGQDIYLYSTIQSSGTAFLQASTLTAIQQDLQAICSRYQDTWTMEVPPIKPLDTYCMEIMLVAPSATQPLKDIWMDIMDKIQILGSAADPDEVKSYFTALFTDPQFFTKYPGATLKMLQMVQNSWSMSFPNDPYNFPDYLTTYLALGYQSSKTPLEQALLTEMQTPAAWSGGSSVLQQWFVNTVTDSGFFSSYPNMQWSDLQTFASQYGFALPTYAQTYFTEGAWVNSHPQDPNYPIMKDLVAQIAAVWKAGGNFSTVSIWAQGVVNGVFLNYSTINEAGAQQLETLTGVSAPSWQAQFFTAKSWRDGLSTTDPNYSIAAGLVTAWQTALGNYSLVQSWASSVVNKVFIDYPTIDEAGAEQLESLTQLSAPSWQPQFFTAKSWLDSLSKTDPNYTIANSLVQAWQLYNGDSSKVQAWAQGIVNDMFSEAPYTTEAGALNLENYTDIPVPTCQHIFFSARGWLNNLQPTDPDRQVPIDLISGMKGTWPNTSLVLVQGWAQNLINNAFSEYPLLDESGAQTLESIVPGLVLPTSQLQDIFFSIRSKMNALDPTSADYQMLADFQQRWTGATFQGTPIWPSQQPVYLLGWFSLTFSGPLNPLSPGMQSIFMQYPLASIAILQWVTTTITSVSSTPTTLDNVYRAAYATHGTDTSGLFYDFFKQCQTVGSTDAKNAVEAWLDNLALGGFSSYTNSTADITSFLNNFPFVTQIGGQNVYLVSDYIVGYIQNMWNSRFKPGTNENRFGNVMISVIETGMSTGNINSLADLQTYLNQNFRDYLLNWPNISFISVATLFTIFGLSPPLTQFDIVLNGVYGALATVTKEYGSGSPDATCLNNLFRYIDQPTPPSLADIQAWMKNNIFNNPSVWNTLKPDTQQMLQKVSDSFF